MRTKEYKKLRSQIARSYKLDSLMMHRALLNLRRVHRPKESLEDAFKHVFGVEYRERGYIRYIV